MSTRSERSRTRSASASGAAQGSQPAQKKNKTNVQEEEEEKEIDPSPPRSGSSLAQQEESDVDVHWVDREHHHGGAQQEGTCAADYIRWRREEWSFAYDGETVDLSHKNNKQSAYELLEVMKMQSPNFVIGESKVEFDDSFDGDLNKVDAFIEATRRKAKALQFTTFLEFPWKEMVKKAVELINVPHRLSVKVGGTLGADQPTKTSTSISVNLKNFPKLVSHIKGLIVYMKNICTIVYEGLTKAMKEDSKMMQAISTAHTQLERMDDDTLLLDYEKENTNEKERSEQMGTSADPHAVWSMLQNKYARTRVEQEKELLLKISQVICKENTRDAVLGFNSQLNLIQQQLERLKGSTADQRAMHRELIHWQRRNGMTDQLLTELNRIELTQPKMEGKKLEDWMSDALIIVNRTSHQTTSAIVSAAHYAPSSQSAPTATTESDSDQRKPKCEFCIKNGKERLAQSHDTEKCRFKTGEYNYGSARDNNAKPADGKAKKGNSRQDKKEKFAELKSEIARLKSENHKLTNVSYLSSKPWEVQTRRIDDALREELRREDQQPAPSPVTPIPKKTDEQIRAEALKRLNSERAKSNARAATTQPTSSSSSSSASSSSSSRMVPAYSNRPASSSSSSSSSSASSSSSLSSSSRPAVKNGVPNIVNSIRAHPPGNEAGSTAELYDYDGDDNDESDDNDN
jgi:hypothetical protein